MNEAIEAAERVYQQEREAGYSAEQAAYDADLCYYATLAEVRARRTREAEHVQYQPSPARSAA